MKEGVPLCGVGAVRYYTGMVSGIPERSFREALAGVVVDKVGMINWAALFTRLKSEVKLLPDLTFQLNGIAGSEVGIPSIACRTDEACAVAGSEVKAGIVSRAGAAVVRRVVGVVDWAVGDAALVGKVVLLPRQTLLVDWRALNQVCVVLIAS